MEDEANMFTDVVEPVAQRLTTAGMDLRELWRTGRTGLDAGEAAIGDDVMAAAFRGIYTGDRDLIMAIADETPGAIEGDGALGVECTGLYLTANDLARAALADRIIDEA